MINCKFKFIFLIFVGVFYIKSGSSKSENKSKKIEKNGEKAEWIIMKLLKNENKNKNKKKEIVDKNTTRIFNADKLRENDDIYNSLQKKYDDRSKLNIRAIDIVDNYKIYITKEINISENVGIFEKEGLLAEEIFDGVKKNELTAFSDAALKTKITYDVIKQRLIKPVVINNMKRRKSVKRFFRNTDIDNIEITGNIIWSRLLRNKVIDYLVVKINIPISKSKLENDITVCYLNYNDFINYISKKKIMVKTETGIKTSLADAITNDKLNVMYTSISDNYTEYLITNSNFKENNFCATKIINELENKFYSYDAFIKS